MRWTPWVKQAENAAAYLGKESHVNVVGRLMNNNDRNGEEVEVYGFAVVCEEIDYLDSRAKAEVRREPGEASTEMPAADAPKPVKAPGGYQVRRTGRLMTPGRVRPPRPLLDHQSSGNDINTTPALATRFARTTHVL